MICSEHSIISADAEGGVAVSFRCKRWSCEICQPFNEAALAGKAAAGIHGQASLFLTLTVDPVRYSTPDNAARGLVKAWRTIRRLVRRLGIERLPFLAVLEQHKSGWPHLHILVRAKFISQRWLSKIMQELTGGRIVHVRRARPGDASYIAGKPFLFGGCKRFWSSRDWLAEPAERSARNWLKVLCNVPRLTVMLERQGFSYTCSRHRAEWGRAPP